MADPFDCSARLHPLALRGIEFYNAGDYFQAHEELELAWREERGPIRDLYRGILQVGLGYYHILRLNYPGAVKMLQRAEPWLAPYPNVCRGVDVAALRSDRANAASEILRLGAENLARFNPIYFRPVLLVGQEPGI